MFDEVLDDLKDCERDLQMLRDDSEVDSWISFTLRCIIYKLQDAQKNLCSIADDCRSVPNETNTEQEFAKIETAGELLEFLSGLSEHDLNKRVVLGRNEYDFSSKWMVRVLGVVNDAEWVRKDDDSILICSK